MTASCPNPVCPQYNTPITFLDSISPDEIYLDLICGTCGTVIDKAPPVEQQI